MTKSVIIKLYKRACKQSVTYKQTLPLKALRDLIFIPTKSEAKIFVMQ